MKPRYLLILLLLWTTLAADLSAQEPEHQIRLVTGAFDPLDQPVARQAPATSPYYLVQFNDAPSDVMLAQLAQLGGQVVSYVPNNSYLVRLDSAVQATQIAALPAVRWVGPYQTEYRVSPALVRQPRTGQLDLHLLAFPGTDAAQLVAFLEGLGATLYDLAETELGVLAQLTLNADQLDQLRAYPELSWVEPYQMPSVTNAEARKIINAETAWNESGFFGAGQVIAISDSGLSQQGALNADFAGRLRQAYPPSELNLLRGECSAKTTWTDLHGHGTHVAGSAVGSGANSGSDASFHRYDGSHAGSAPEAELVFMALNTDGSQNIQCLSSNGSFIAKGYEAGARISSNSWSTDPDGSYSLLSSIVDNYVWENKDYLVLFAAGNLANAGSTTVAAPGTAKNVLTVGATENYRQDLGIDADDPGQLTGFSGRGPTKDNRIKPEVVAPGTYLLSVRAAQAPDSSFWANHDQNYAYLGGTSMSTPLTAGSAALVREWLGERRGLPNPSAALLKALMVHGALAVTDNQPNNDSGWGRVDVKNTLNAKYIIFDENVQGLTTGETRTFTLNLLGNNTTVAGTQIIARPPVTRIHQIRLIDRQNSSANAYARNVSLQLSATPLPGYDQPASNGGIPDAAEAGEKTISLLQDGPTLMMSSEMSSTPRPVRSSAQPQRAPRTYLQDMLLGGGDFEDPTWTDRWKQVWLGSGVPLRTSRAEQVLSGTHSIWLGGTQVSDFMWYPLHFPDEIDTSQTSLLSLQVKIEDQDFNNDQFCISITDVSGGPLGPFADAGYCIGVDGLYNYNQQFSSDDLASFAGQTGYLVLFAEQNGTAPHASAFVDNVVLNLDFASVKMASTPMTGPAGSTFLIQSQNLVPYSEVDICVSPCGSGADLCTGYADNRGDLLAYITTDPNTPEGTYTIEVRDVAGRVAQTRVVIGAVADATLTASPLTGQAGTEFAVNGQNFFPNDAQVEIQLNDTFAGVVSSDDAGGLNFSFRTQGDSAVGTYTVKATGSGGKTASSTFQVTSLPTSAPLANVTPTQGPPGTAFTMRGTNFLGGQAVTLRLDGTLIGSIDAEANGSFEVSLSTASDIGPGNYTLQAVQGDRSATASFQITSDTVVKVDQGLYVTLAWTDPPAQTNAASTLVNDLHLTVTGPSGTVYHGNGGTNPDTVNNTETIRLASPAAGRYIIRVIADRVSPSYGTQPYALIATTEQNYGTDSSTLYFGETQNAYLPILVR